MLWIKKTFYSLPKLFLTIKNIFMKSKEFEQFLQNLTPKLHQTSTQFTALTTANNHLTTLK